LSYKNGFNRPAWLVLRRYGYGYRGGDRKKYNGETTCICACSQKKVRTHLILILDAVGFFYPRFFAHPLASRGFQQGDFDVFVRFSGRGISKAFH
jgi:hypothetical protein